MDAWMIAAISFVVVGGATFGAAYLLLWRWPVVTRERLEGRGLAEQAHVESAASLALSEAESADRYGASCRAMRA